MHVTSLYSSHHVENRKVWNVELGWSYPIENTFFPPHRLVSWKESNFLAWPDNMYMYHREKSHKKRGHGSSSHKVLHRLNAELSQPECLVELKKNQKLLAILPKFRFWWKKHFQIKYAHYCTLVLKNSTVHFMPTVVRLLMVYLARMDGLQP